VPWAGPSGRPVQTGDANQLARVLICVAGRRGNGRFFRQQNAVACLASVGRGAVRKSMVVAMLLLVNGCANPPTSSSVEVMPRAGKTLEQFDRDQQVCRHYAAAQVMGEAEHGNWTRFATHGGGKLPWAGRGGVISDGKGNASSAGAGAIGSMAVSGIGSSSAQTMAQQRYDNSFGQCMLIKGNQVPGFPPWVPGRRT
jgi:hypothetical protein